MLYCVCGHTDDDHSSPGPGGVVYWAECNKCDCWHFRQTCPLCQIPTGEILIDHQRWLIVRTKTMKGHRERIMLYIREHKKELGSEQEIGEAYIYLYHIGRKLFEYTRFWAILEPTFATVPDHWHRIATDLNPKAEDAKQVLRTPRLNVDNELMSVERASVFE